MNNRQNTTLPEDVEQFVYIFGALYEFLTGIFIKI